MSRFFAFCLCAIFNINGAYAQTAYEYEGHKYYRTASGLTWAQAEAEAVGLGGHLVTINDADEQSFVNSLNSFSIWTGLSDRIAEGDFRWANGEPLSFVNWYTFEPNGGETENCVESIANVTGAWNDLPCDRLLSGIVEVACDISLTVPIYDGQTWVSGCDVQINGVVLTDSVCPVVTRIEWDWGDGTVNDSFFAAPHTYETNGDYLVSVTPFVSSGASTTGTVPISIVNCPAENPPPPAGVGVGLGLWLRADAGLSTVENNVFSWRDMSGNERNATQHVWPRQPQRTGVLNGYPVLSFDFDFMDFDGSFLAESDYTIFAVEGRDRAGLANFFVAGFEPLPNSNLVLGYERIDLLRQAHFSNDLDAVIPAYTGTQEFAITTFVFDSLNGRTIYRFGEELASDGNTLPLLSYVGAAIGRFAPFNYYYKGDIAELIFYNEALSCAERANVELYLAGKYDLSLTYDSVIQQCAEEPIGQVIGQVLDIDLSEGIENSLRSKLDGALANLTDTNATNDVAATNILEAFINTVEAQRGKIISNEDADRLILNVQEIIDFLHGA